MNRNMKRWVNKFLQPPPPSSDPHPPKHLTYLMDVHPLITEWTVKTLMEVSVYLYRPFHTFCRVLT